MQEVADNVVSSATHRSGGQAGSGGGRGQPTASGSGRCLPETSSRESEDAGDGRRAERSEAE